MFLVKVWPYVYHNIHQESLLTSSLFDLFLLQKSLKNFVQPLHVEQKRSYNIVDIVTQAHSG